MEGRFISILIVAFLCILCLSILCVVMWFKNQSLIKLLNESSSTKDKFDEAKKELTKIVPGDMVIRPKYPLMWGKGTDQEERFEVTFELEVLEISDKKLKVKAIDYQTTNKKALDPTSKSGVLGIIDGQWVSKSEVELLVNDRVLRDIKIDEILN